MGPFLTSFKASGAHTKANKMGTVISERRLGEGESELLQIAQEDAHGHIGQLFDHG